MLQCRNWRTLRLDKLWQRRLKATSLANTAWTVEKGPMFVMMESEFRKQPSHRLSADGCLFLQAQGFIVVFHDPSEIPLHLVSLPGNHGHPGLSKEDPIACEE